MADPNTPDFNSGSSEAFSYEHLIALEDQDSDTMPPPSQPEDKEDIVDLTVNDTAALWGEALGGDIPISPNQIIAGSIRGRHIRRY